MGIPTLITTNTITSSTTTSSFTGIDDTYDEYMVLYYNLNAGAQQEVVFNGSIDNGSNYDVTKTGTYFSAVHTEDDTTIAELSYKTGKDIAQGTGFMHLTKELEGASDDGDCGILHLFSPASTTYVTHFYARTLSHSTSNAIHDAFIAGYFNSTDNIDAIQFKLASGNMDTAVFKLFGIS